MSSVNKNETRKFPGQRIAATESSGVTSHGDLILVCTRLSFNTVSLETTLREFTFCLTCDEKVLTFTSILSSSLHPSSFLSLSLEAAPTSPKKRPWCMKSETGLIPVSSVHMRVQLCIQNHRKCVSKRTRERWHEPNFTHKAPLG